MFFCILFIIFAAYKWFQWLNIKSYEEKAEINRDGPMPGSNGFCPNWQHETAGRAEHHCRRAGLHFHGSSAGWRWWHDAEREHHLVEPKHLRLQGRFCVQPRAFPLPCFQPEVQWDLHQWYTNERHGERPVPFLADWRSEPYNKQQQRGFPTVRGNELRHVGHGRLQQLRLPPQSHAYRSACFVSSS